MMEFLYTIIIFPIIQILEFSFFVSQKLFKESGISVIFISLVISILCLPLYAVAEKWQLVDRNTRIKLMPKVNKIKKVFKGDEQYLILSAYYRQNHYHPIYTLRGSFGLFIQIPFFIAAYSYLSNLEVIKNVPFFFIRNLSLPDALLSMGEFKINLLPVAMTLINCIAGSIYAKELPVKDKIQLYGMAGLFLLLLYNSPSALVLYWTMNNVFSLIKNVYYRLKFRYKHYVLLGFVSACCMLMAVFCLKKYYYNSKAEKLAFVFIVTAIAPWIFVLFRTYFKRFSLVKYERGKSIAVFLLSVFLIWVTFGFFIPSQLIASSPQEFSFIDEYTNPLIFIFYASVQIFGLFFFWPACLYFLFSDKIKNYFSLVFFTVSICMLINVFLFPGNYGPISLNFVYESGLGHSTKEIACNFLIFLIPAVIAYLLYNKGRKNIIFPIISLSAFSLLCISVYNIFMINASFNEMKKHYIKQNEIKNEISALFPFSKKGKNIAVIMLDRAVNAFIPFIFEESPELNDSYSGFVYYPNTAAFNGYTRIGAPPVFGGYEYTPEEINKRNTVPLVEKHNQSLIMLPRVFSENGFSVFVTDPPYANYNKKSDVSIFNNYHDIQAYITDAAYTDIWLDENEIKLPKTGEIIKRNMFWYSIVKGLPLFFRQPVYMDGNWCSPLSVNRLRMTLNGYSVLDYLPKLTKIEDNEKNNTLIMTNNTTHEGSFLQAPGYVPATVVTDYGKTRFAKEHAYHINAAAIKRLANWFDYLKKEGVYNNTRIILVSDHGPVPNFVIKTELPFNVEQFNPLLMVKDFNASKGMETDFTFMSNADVPSLALEGLIDEPRNPFTGNEISKDKKKEPLYIAISGSIHLSESTDSQFQLNVNKDYYVHDNIFVSSNWIPATERN